MDVGRWPIPRPSYLDDCEYLGFVNGNRTWRSKSGKRFLLGIALTGRLRYLICAADTQCGCCGSQLQRCLRLDLVVLPKPHRLRLIVLVHCRTAVDRSSYQIVLHPKREILTIQQAPRRQLVREPKRSDYEKELVKGYRTAPVVALPHETFAVEVLGSTDMVQK